MSGEEITHYPDGSFRRNVLKLRLGRIQVKLIQDPRIPIQIGRVRGERLHTTDIEFGEVPLRKRDWAIQVSRDIAWLLAFATMSPVNVFGWDHGGRGQRWNAYGTLQHFRPILHFGDAKSLKGFMESTWPAFRREKRTRRLASVIHWCVQSEASDQPVEQRLLATFVALESLKATYALGAGIPYKGGGFRKPNGGKYTFEDLLKMMFVSQGMRPALKRFVKARNAIVHFGLSRTSVERSYQQYEKAHDLIREYLLRVLEFEGPYYSFSRPNGPRVKLRA
jgi:hypothetical protein